MVFESKDWRTIGKYLFDRYDNRFIYLNHPDLKEKEAYLLIRYIKDRKEFDSIISELIKKGISISIIEDY